MTNRSILAVNPFNMVKKSDMVYISFVLVEFTRFFKVIPLLIANVCYVALGFFSLIYVIKNYGVKKQLTIFTFLFVYIYFGVLGVMANGNIDIQEMFWPIAFIGISILFLNEDITLKLTKRMYFLAALVIIVQIMIAGGVDEISAVSSRNTLSIMMLLFFSIYAISSYSSNVKAEILPVLTGLVVVILAIGRSGILTFALLLFFFLIFEFSGRNQRVKKISRMIFWSILIIVFIIVVYLLFQPLVTNALRNFSSRGLESVRTGLWSDYLAAVSSSVKYFYFGAQIQGTDLLNRYSSNLHNSLLMLHAKYGLFIFVSVIILTINALVYFIKKRNFLFFTLLVVILFRMQFDYTNFNAQLDIAFFYLLFFKYYDAQFSDKVIVG